MPSVEAPTVVEQCLNDFAVAFAIFEGVPMSDRDDLVAAFCGAAEASASFRRRLLTALLCVEHHVTVDRNELHSFLRGNRFNSLCFDGLCRAHVRGGIDAALAPVVAEVLRCPMMPEEDSWPTPFSSPQASMADVPTDAMRRAQFEGAAGDGDEGGTEDEEDTGRRPPTLAGAITGVTRHMSKCLDLLVGVVENLDAPLLPDEFRGGFAAFAAQVRRNEGSRGRESVVEEHLDRAAVSGVFLRVVSPRLINPPRSDDEPRLTPEQRRRLMLFAKVAQKAANHASFEQPGFNFIGGGSAGNVPASLFGDASPAMPSSSASLQAPTMSAHSPEFLAAFNPIIATAIDPLLAAIRKAAGTSSDAAVVLSTETSSDTATARIREAAADVQRIAIANFRGVLSAFQRVMSGAPHADLLLAEVLQLWGPEAASLSAAAASGSPGPKKKGFLKTLFGKSKSTAATPQPSTDDLAALDSSGTHGHQPRTTPAFAGLASGGCRLLEADPVPCSMSEVALAASCMWTCGAGVVVICEEALRAFQRVHNTGAMAHTTTPPHSPSSGPASPPSDASSAATGDPASPQLPSDAAAPMSATDPAASPPRDQSHHTAEAPDVLAATLAARFWALFGMVPFAQGETGATVLFLSYSKATSERRDLGFAWFMRLLEAYPRGLTDSIAKIVLVRPNLMSRMLTGSRRLSLGRKGDSLQERVATADAVDDALLAGSGALDTIAIPPEFLPKSSGVSIPDVVGRPLGVEAASWLARRSQCLSWCWLSQRCIGAVGRDGLALADALGRDRQATARRVESLSTCATLVGSSTVTAAVPLIAGNEPLGRVMADQLLLYREKLCDAACGVFPEAELRELADAGTEEALDAALGAGGTAARAYVTVAASIAGLVARGADPDAADVMRYIIFSAYARKLLDAASPEGTASVSSRLAAQAIRWASTHGGAAFCLPVDTWSS